MEHHFAVGKIKKYIKVILAFSILVFIAINFLMADDIYLISKNDFKEKIRANKRTLVIVWTGWCPISKKVIPNVWYNLEDYLKENGIDSTGIIVLTPDRNPTKTITIHRDNGIQNSYQIPSMFINSGVTDRPSIRKFLGNALGANIVDKLTRNSVLYGVPLEFIVNDKFELVSPFVPRDKAEIVKYLKRIDELQKN